MTRAVVIFGREPRPGKVKTRLARELGETAATAVYRALLEHTVRAARAVGVPVTLALATAPSSRWHAPPGVAVEVQSGTDLGERMDAAFQRRFASGADQVVLVGSDLALLDPAHFRRAFVALAAAPVVLGPATDGGYWLIGQKRPGVDIFSGIPWSSVITLSATRARLAALGTPSVELERLPDVDTVSDLRAALADERLDSSLRRTLEDAAGFKARGG